VRFVPVYLNIKPPQLFHILNGPLGRVCEVVFSCFPLKAKISKFRDRIYEWEFTFGHLLIYFLWVKVNNSKITNNH